MQFKYQKITNAVKDMWKGEPSHIVSGNIGYYAVWRNGRRLAQKSKHNFNT
jgi:hypothetical protein